MSKKTESWKFIREDILDAPSVDTQTKNWENVSIPHTWNSQDVFNAKKSLLSFIKKDNGAYYQGIGWYRTNLELTKKDLSKRIFLKFQAVSIRAKVYVNGSLVGTHNGAFSAFCFEITEFLKTESSNVVAVRVNNRRKDDIAPISGDFPIMGGIYRPVNLIIKNNICISPLDYASTGIYISQKKVSEESALIGIKTLINFGSIASNSTSQKNQNNLNLRLSIFDAASNEIIVENVSIDERPSKNSDTVVISKDLKINKPHLWQGVFDPYLYTLKAEIIDDNEILDCIEEKIGLRYFHIDHDHGFFLNGKKYPIYGVSRHQDRKDRGWALREEDHDEDMNIILEMGCRGIRLAHYQHSDYFYSLCDKYGLLTWAEIPVVNQVKFTDEFMEKHISNPTPLRPVQNVERE